MSEDYINVLITPVLLLIFLSNVKDKLENPGKLKSIIFRTEITGVLTQFNRPQFKQYTNTHVKQHRTEISSKTKFQNKVHRIRFARYQHNEATK